ncbi:hypothetical protein ACJMK2_025400 [Sinanodonta woodiana]|uniref:PA domain-containing protein n=1 Tax=Sinanodonta woodiana TaxID=1069815 RepID=A0ABD3XGC6_SINWO
MVTFIYFLGLTFVVSQVAGDYGVVSARKKGDGTPWTDFYCISFNKRFRDLPSTTADHVMPRPLLDLSSVMGCSEQDFANVNATGSVVAVNRGQCNFTDKARLAQKSGAVGILICSQDSLFTPAAVNETTDFVDINITVAIVMWSSFTQIQKLGSILEVILFVPVLETRFDPNMIIIFLIAVSCIIIGGYWSGITQLDKRKRRMRAGHRGKEGDRGSRTDTDLEEGEEEDDEASVEISIPAIIIFFVLVCTFIILLYFFYDYLVYVVIGLFVIAGSSGLYYCLKPIFNRMIPVTCRVPPNKVPCFRSRPDAKNLLIFGLCLAVGIFWAVQRKAVYAWILQNILGYAFCINMLRTAHLPSLKICTILLLMLFVYDIFFVFITPLFTSSGDSIMIDVATGDKSTTGEKLPMVFQVPRLTNDAVNACPQQYSLLGFGDIVVPGLLAGYSHAFDLTVNSSRVYFIGVCIAYAVGLVITFVALALLKTGQPALLYLVPCTLVTVFLIGWKRREVKQLWNGKAMCPKKNDDHTQDVEKANSESAVSVKSEVSSNSSTDNENRTLLRR